MTTSTTTTLRTPRARVSYPHLTEPQADDQGKLWYTLKLIFDPEAQQTAEFAEMKARAKAVADEDIRKNYGGVMPEGYRNPIRKAESQMKNGEYPEGMGPGFVFINVKTKTRPGVVSTKRGPDGKPLPISPDNVEDEIYPGCYVRATLSEPWPYAQKGNKGVSFYFNNLQKLGEGERLGNRRNATDDFEALDDSAPAATGDDSAIWD